MQNLFAVFKKPYDVVSEEEGQFEEGFWKSGTQVFSTVWASIQPAQEEDEQFLPEGRSLSGSFRLFTFSKLKVADAGGRELGDKVIFNKQVYEVTGQLPWLNTLIPHHVFLMTRVLEKKASDYE